MLFFYQNVNRFRTKLNEFYLNVLNSDYDVICLTETNLDSSISSAEFFDSRYTIIRRDRDSLTSHKQSGGGILVAIKKNISLIRLSHLESDSECIWLSLNPGRSIITLCLAYLPPDVSIDRLHRFYDKTGDFISEHDGHVIILGDFNTPSIDWNGDMTKAATPICNSYDLKSRLLIQLMSLGGLGQYNYIKNSNKRTLDIFLTNIPNIKLAPALALCREDIHHPSFEIDIKHNVPNYLKRNTSNPVFNFNKCDLTSIRKELKNIDWYSILSSNNNINDLLGVFYEKLFLIIKSHTPYKKKFKDKQPAWFSQPLIKCLKEKQKMHTKYKMYNNPRDYDTFSLLRCRAQRLMEECYNTYINNVEMSLVACNDKLFWNFTKSKRKCNSMPQTLSYNKRVATTGFEICELFSDYFASVYTQDNHNTLSSTCSVDTYVSTLSKISLSESEILKKIKTLDRNKGPGPDGIPSSFIKSCGKELAVPLMLIFNKSLDTGCFPELWKVAHVIPIFKAGTKTECSNYRPICILNCFAKIFESIVYDYIYYLFKPLISPQQHGFVKSKSTVTNLIEYSNIIVNSLDNKKQVDSVYTDFQKAFDKVNHQLLFHKLERYGVHGDLLRWVISYVTNRSQIVAVNGFYSKPITVPSGVPQGSHLGPLLFNIFINDITSVIKNKCLLYADDLKIFCEINNVQDCISLQEDLNSVKLWCEQNAMFLNVSKCFVLTFTKNRNKIKFDYLIGNDKLSTKTSARDLGITFDTSLTFKLHINNIIAKANKMMGFIFRTTKGFRNPLSLLHLYKCLIRSILEYGTPVWSPYQKTYADSIESVQRRFLRILLYKFNRKLVNSSYKDKLKLFKLDSLCMRRKLHDTMLLHKTINSQIDTTLLSKINLNCKIPKRSICTFNVFPTKLCRTNLAHYSCINRICRLYNTLQHNNKDLNIFNSSKVCFRRNVMVSLCKETN